MAFAQGERVLCYHGPLMYEAKCLASRKSPKGDEFEYMVHYQGWNKNWDEWVPEDRILKFNDLNLAKQKEVAEQAKKDKLKKRSKGGTRNSRSSKEAKLGDIKSEGSVHDPDSRSSTPSVEGRSRGNSVKGKGKLKEPVAGDLVTSAVEKLLEAASEDQSLPESENQSNKRPRSESETTTVPEKITKLAIPSLRPSDIDFNKEQILYNPNNANVVIPKRLEDLLIEDGYQITRLSRLVNLPADITVSDILQRYKTHKLTTIPPEEKEDFSDLVANVDILFCKSLGNFLLYKWERPQYSDMLAAHPNVPISKIYGSVHFLRFFKKTSLILANLPASFFDQLVKHLEDIMDFLVKNEKEFFPISNFGIAQPEYHRRAL